MRVSALTTLSVSLVLMAACGGSDDVANPGPTVVDPTGEWYTSTVQTLNEFCAEDPEFPSPRTYESDERLTKLSETSLRDESEGAGEECSEVLPVVFDPVRRAYVHEWSRTEGPYTDTAGCVYDEKWVGELVFGQERIDGLLTVSFVQVSGTNCSFDVRCVETTEAVGQRCAGCFDGCFAPASTDFGEAFSAIRGGGSRLGR